MIDPALLERSPLLASVNPGTRRALAAVGVGRRFPAGATLFHAGTPARGLILILEGSVRVMGMRDGRQHLVHEGGPGDTLGEVPLLAGGGYPATAIARSDCHCAIFSAESLRGVMKQDPGFAWLLLSRLAGRVRELVARLERNTAWSVEGRLAEFLLARHAEQGGGTFGLGSSQAALAEELGTVREVVVRTLAGFRKAGLITTAGRGRYRVRDLDGLRGKAV